MENEKQDSSFSNQEVIEEEINAEETPSEKVLEAIRKLDSGKGADFDEVIKCVDNGEHIVHTLMAEGEIFEVSPGKLKVL